ncbi:major facilitator superfamily domain-containing protein [Fennellomyces sp. T-0311]|nr:major facilitator superfamily domain-containing protein [Fennellomyces sp. T-0311]
MTNTPLFLGLKLLHIFSIGCVGSAHFYLPTFYNAVLHLGADKIGFLASIIPFVSCLSFPLWMSWIDKNKQYKKTMVLNMLVGLLFILFIAVVPSITTDEWTATALASVGCLGYAFFAYPVIGIMLDSATIRVLNVRKRDLYGRQKAGTPIGFGSAVFLTGLSIEIWGTYAVFGTFTACVVLFVIVCSTTNLEPYPWNIVPDGSTENSTSEADDKKHASMWDLIEQPQALKFFVVMTFLGTVMGVVVAFLFLFIEKDLHGSPALVGLLGPLASCTEVICFYFARNIFRWLGPRKMLIIAHMIVVIRCVIYAGATTMNNSNGAILAAVAQPLHGTELRFFMGSLWVV